MDRPMRRFFRILTNIVAVGVLVFFLLLWDVYGWWPIPSAFGKHAAHIDISRGNYKELGYGLPFLGSDEYARLLQERYGIEFHYVDFCTVSKSRRDYSDAYNQVSMEAAESKFGRDIFKETYDEAVKNWKLAHPAKAAN
jgi:hypothetical protein